MRTKKRVNQGPDSGHRIESKERKKENDPFKFSKNELSIFIKGYRPSGLSLAPLSGVQRLCVMRPPLRPGGGGILKGVCAELLPELSTIYCATDISFKTPYFNDLPSLSKSQLLSLLSGTGHFWRSSEHV